MNNFGPPVEFDAGDGLGYRYIQRGGSMAVSYTSGIHHLKMRFNYNNQYYYAHGQITTYSTEVLSRFLFTDFIDVNLNMGEVCGKLWRPSSCTSPKSISKPFLIIEGFDPQEFSKYQNRYSLWGHYGTQGPQNFLSNEVFSDSLEINGYTIFYLDFKDSKLSIKENAKLLESAINIIKSYMSDSSDPIIVFGSSMGGLIARYGLRMMEMEGKKHYASTLICQDTPNLGANIPLGFLYGAYAILDLYKKYNINFYTDLLKDDINCLKEILHCQSAKEMLFNYVDEYGNINNVVHESFMTELSSMGYPKGDNGDLRCIALCNGNKAVTQSNERYLRLNSEFTISDVINIFSSYIQACLIGYITKDIENFLISSIPGGSNGISCRADIRPSAPNSNVCDIKLTYRKKLLWLFNTQNTFCRYRMVAPAGIYYDTSYGSYYRYRSSINEENNNISLSLLNGILSFNSDLYLNPNFNFLFIPTVSALDIGEGKYSLTNGDFHSNYYMNNRPSPPKHTPFHSYYISNESEEHIFINDEMANWIINQLNTYMIGDFVASTGSRYALVNQPNGTSVSWSTSDSNIATISSSGVLTAYGQGFVDVIATLSNVHKYSQYVCVGFPNYYLTSTYNSNGYGVFCNVQNPNGDFRIIKDKVSYDVKVCTPGSNPPWSPCPEQYVFLPLSNSSSANVYFRMKYVDENNNVKYGPTVNLYINTSFPYIIEPTYFRVNTYSDQNNITIRKNPYYVGDLPEYLDIYYFMGEGDTGLSSVYGVNTLVITAEDVFGSARVAEFRNRSSSNPISASFTLKNQYGEDIQSFVVSMIK